MPKHFKKLGENLFCNDYLMQAALANTNHFLVKLGREMDFGEIWHEKLLQTYKGEAELGQPPYRPELMLKMLFLSYLFRVSEREIERAVNDSISMKAFLGMAFEEKAPDHSSLTYFRNRILANDERKDTNLFKELFDDIIRLAQRKGIDLKYTQVMDSTHTVADVNTKKDEKRQRPPSEKGDGKPPRDPDAQWGVKRIKNIKTEDGRQIKVKESYYGYKSHFSGSAFLNLITSYLVSPMARYDGHFFEPLMRDDLRKGVAKKEKTIYAADKGYDDGENHVWLNQEHLKDAISLIGSDRKNPKAKWTLYTTQKEFEEGLKQRYTIERMNASVKKDHGLGRARYLGIKKYNIQVALTAMAHNLKTLVKIWTGVSLKGPILDVS